jgi:hypothetical protein
MPNNDTITVSCKITRSGFPTERVFRVQLASGETHVGAAPRPYFFTAGGRPLDENQPGQGKSLDGRIMARRIRPEEAGNVLVSVPDGAVLMVREDRIGAPPKEASTDVPVQS